MVRCTLFLGFAGVITIVGAELGRGAAAGIA